MTQCPCAPVPRMGKRRSWRLSAQRRHQRGIRCFQPLDHVEMVPPGIGRHGTGPGIAEPAGLIEEGGAFGAADPDMNRPPEQRVRSAGLSAAASARSSWKSSFIAVSIIDAGLAVAFR